MADLDEAETRRLRWRCRRGMRELDQLMLRYLDQRWPQAEDAERKQFLRLLDCEDDDNGHGKHGKLRHKHHDKNECELARD